MPQATGTFEVKLVPQALANRGAPQLSVSVVPDSGTDELAGLSGTLGIKITDGRHSYVMEYEIAPQA